MATSTPKAGKNTASAGQPAPAVQADSPDESLTEALRTAIKVQPVGQRRGALEALHTALQEVKHRAASLDEHLRADFDEIVKRIREL